MGGVNPGTANLVVHDIDLDGRPEVIYGDQAWDADGNLVWASGQTTSHRIIDVMALNLDDDAYPEIVQLTNFARIRVVDHTGKEVWSTSDGHQGGDSLSAADLDGDGRPEIVLAGFNFLVAYQADGTQVWRTTFPVTTNGGYATIFDLNGDGDPEVIYQGRSSPAADSKLYVLRGSDGEILHAVAAPAYSNLRGPMVVDVTGDGHAEIVTYFSTGAGNFTKVRIFGPAEGVWARTRPIWNQDPYYITPIKPDGTVAFPAVPNWLIPGLNNHRVNVRLPEERDEEHDTFRYRANDGAFDSNVATVHVTVRHDHPPEIRVAAEDRRNGGDRLSLSRSRQRRRPW